MWSFDQASEATLDVITFGLIFFLCCPINCYLKNLVRALLVLTGVWALMLRGHRAAKSDERSSHLAW